MKKYEQLLNDLRQSILNGSLPKGSRLPSEAKLSSQTGYSRQTVRQALDILEKENLIIKKHGSGSYVSGARLPVRTMRIAVILRFFNNYFFPSLIEGIESAASEHKYSVVLHATHNDVEQERNTLCSILEDNVDGILVEGCSTALPNPNLDIYKELLANGMPIVFINCYYKDFFTTPVKNCAYVSIDDESASYDITSALIATGHKKIGAIMKYDEIFGHQRCSGFMRAMTENGLPVSDSSIVWFGNNLADDFEEALIKSNIQNKCTALLCYNDMVANQFFHIAKGQFGCVTSVGSFDGTNIDIPDGIEFLTRPNPIRKMSRIATEKLIHLINGEPEESILIPMRDES